MLPDLRNFDSNNETKRLRTVSISIANEPHNLSLVLKKLCYLANERH
jgi:hypothetical protein